jgi:hypothetical protein
MSIKFVCTCGKRLRARDDMAARRSFCPRCGSPVGIPSQEPTHPGTPAAPLSPMQRRQLARQRATQDRAVPPEELAAAMMPAPAATPVLTRAEITPDVGLDRQRPARARTSETVQPVVAPKPLPVRRRWGLEAAWYHCLLYPVHTFPMAAGLAVGLAILMTFFVLALPSSTDVN